MPKYHVNRLLQGVYTGKAESDTLKPGQIVTESQLKAIGFDGKDGRRSLDDLLTSRDQRFGPAISVQKGTEDYVEPRLSEVPTGGNLDTAPKPEVQDGNPGGNAAKK